jgi:DNA helicase-2/ATP-dependent DNA helicase PcrA
MNDFDTNTLKISHLKESALSKPYSYTADYLAFERCPRQYMVFRKYGFIPSRSQTMFFGSLVHNTIEDLHQFLISKREKQS